MTNAGFTKCSAEKTDECYTVNGRDVHFVSRMNIQKNLIMPSCNLTIDGHMYLYNYQELNVEVNNLTIYNTTRGYHALEIARYSKNTTLTVNGNLDSKTTTSNYGISLGGDGVQTLDVKGYLKAASGSNSSVSIATKTSLFVGKDAEMDGIVDIRGTAHFNSNVKVSDDHFSGSATSFTHSQYNAQDTLFIGGNLEVKAKKTNAVRIIMNYTDVEIKGNVIAESQTNDGFHVNFSGSYCDGTAGHTLKIYGDLTGIGGVNGDMYGVGICQANVFVGGNVIGNTKKGKGCVISTGAQLTVCGNGLTPSCINHKIVLGSISCSSPNLYGLNMTGSSSKPCYLFASSISTKNRSDLTCRLSTSNEFFYINNQQGYRTSSGSCYTW